MVREREEGMSEESYSSQNRKSLGGRYRGSQGLANTKSGHE